MNQIAHITPSQRAWHEAAKAREANRQRAARRIKARQPLALPPPEPPCEKRIVFIGPDNFNAHISAWNTWQREQADMAGSPMRCYIKDRAIQLMSTYAQVARGGRSRVEVNPRHLIIWEIRTKNPHMSYPEIGALFDLDHTSVLHAERRIQTIVDEGRLEQFIKDHIALVKRGGRRRARK